MKGTLAMSLTTTLDRPVVAFLDIGGLMTLVLGEIGVEEVKFNDTTGTTCVLDISVLTYGGESPPTNIAEVGV